MAFWRSGCVMVGPQGDWLSLRPKRASRTCPTNGRCRCTGNRPPAGSSRSVQAKVPRSRADYVGVSPRFSRPLIVHPLQLNFSVPGTPADVGGLGWLPQAASSMRSRPLGVSRALQALALRRLPLTLGIYRRTWPMAMDLVLDLVACCSPPDLRLVGHRGLAALRQATQPTPSCEY